MYLSEIVRAISDLHIIDNEVKSLLDSFEVAKKTIDNYKIQVKDLNDKITQLNKKIESLEKK
jgi:peptidoglycan hydrolase CwlO-like protein